MKHSVRCLSILSVCWMAGPLLADESPLIPAPPQDQGLPYTRSASSHALAKIKESIAVFAGSRYAYVNGLKVRLDDVSWRDEAALRDGVLYVPESFASVCSGAELHPDAAPAYLADRWVHTLQRPKVNVPASIPRLTIDGRPYIALADFAAAKGLQVTQHPRGLLLVGPKKVAFSTTETPLLESVITLFDTPEKLADPDIATRSIPVLQQQRKWTEHVKVTPEQLALLNGPETKWDTAKKADYQFVGFNQTLLGSKVPEPGVYPRLLFSAQDLPLFAQRVKQNKLGQKALIEMEVLFQKSWWDPKTSDGQIFAKLSSGDLSGLEWDRPPGAAPSGIPHQFKGQKPGIYNSHIAYVPECLTSMALYCLLTGDEAHGKQAATAIANYYKLREPLIDEWNTISDSEFGSSYPSPDGSICKMNGGCGATTWRGMHGIVAHMNLGLSLDFAGKWMSPGEKETMRRVIAKATYGKRAYGQDAPVRFRDVNWVGWDLPHFLALAAIEGLEGFDREAYESNCDTVRAFCDWGVDDSGVVYESNGKTPGSMQFITLSMITLARRGENLWGHPHWRKLLQGQIQMTSPSGRVSVNSGTQYSPFSQQKLSLQLVDEIKAFFPGDRTADYLLSQANPDADGTWKLDGFDPVAYREKIAKTPRVRLPSPTYPGFVQGVLYDTDYVTTSRADLQLPLDFTAPTTGVYSSYSDRTKEAAWMCLMVRPHHYLGAGHHHADAGMFHFSGLGVDWFTESALSQVYDGKLHNQVLVDGISEPERHSGTSTSYQAAAKFLGSKVGPTGSCASADLTDSYSYYWQTQPGQVWEDQVAKLNWEMDPSPQIAKIFAGTARYKLRPWWSGYTYSNFIATSRAPFNPMQYVYRTTGLVRGSHPYGIVIDDLNKDGQTHLYQWTAMLNGGVWQAAVPGLAPNQMALAFREPDPKAKPVAPTVINPKLGDPILLVCALGASVDAKSDQPLMQVETLAAGVDRKGNPQSCDRFTINQRDVVSRFRVLLIPCRMGEELPKVSYDAASGIATVSWKDQSDRLQFAARSPRTHVQVTRGGQPILSSED